jgi:hypothetical protein
LLLAEAVAVRLDHLETAVAAVVALAGILPRCLIRLTLCPITPLRLVLADQGVQLLRLDMLQAEAILLLRLCLLRLVAAVPQTAKEPHQHRLAALVAAVLTEEVVVLELLGREITAERLLALAAVVAAGAAERERLAHQVHPALAVMVALV